MKALSTPDIVLKVTAVGRQLGYALYLILDALQWAHGSKAYVFEKETYQKIAKNAARFWLAGLTFSLISGTYKSYNLISVIRWRNVRKRRLKRKLSAAWSLTRLPSKPGLYVCRCFKTFVTGSTQARRRAGSMPTMVWWVLLALCLRVLVLVRNGLRSMALKNNGDHFMHFSRC